MSTDNTDQQGQPDIKSLRERAEQAAALEARVKELERQTMFHQAGIDFEGNKIGRMLYQTFEGDLDTLRAEATELGIIGGASATPPQIITPDPNLSAQQQIREAISGGVPAGGADAPSPHPIHSALEGYHQARKNGIPEEQAQALAFEKVYAAAASGDPRAIFDINRWREEQEAARFGLTG